MTLKQRLYIRVVTSPLALVASCLVRQVTASQVALLRIRDVRRVKKKPIVQPLGVTAVIKTFERPKQLMRLLKSLRALYPSLPVIVVDDSFAPVSYDLEGVRTVRLPFNSGVSAGRQAGVDVVDTPYVWIMDDDFVLCSKSRIAPLVRYLDDNPSIGLVGGNVINLPRYKTSDSKVKALACDTSDYEAGRFVDGLEVRLKVPNFYVGRIEVIKRVGWDKKLKRLDHHDFFTRAYGTTRVAYAPEFSCLHVKDMFDTAYLRFRYDITADRKRLEDKYPSYYRDG